MSRLCFRLLALMLGSSIAHVAALTADEVRKDALGDPLPPGAIARFGTVRLRHTDSVTMLRFSPDGKRLISQAGHNTLGLWSTASGQELRRKKSEAAVITVAFTAAGKACYAFGDMKQIHLVDAATSKRLRIIEAGEEPIHEIVISPNGKVVGAAIDDAPRHPELRRPGSEGGHVHLWLTATAKEIANFPVSQARVARLLFSADGNTLAEIDYERSIRIRATATGKVRGRIQGKKREALVGLALSPDGTKLATSGYDHVVRLWDATTGTEERSWQHPSASLEFSPDGQTLVCGGWDGMVTLFDVATGKKRRSFAAHVGPVQSMAYSADGKILATGGGGLFSHRVAQIYWDRDCTIRLWDAASGKELPPAFGPRAAVVSLAYAPDGKTLAAAGKDQLLRVWRIGDGKLVQRLEGHKGTISSLTFSPDGKVLASASHDKSVRLWQVAADKKCQEIELAGGVESIAFSPDGKLLAAAAGDTYLWDAATGKEMRRLRLANDSIYAVAFSPDSRLLATAGGWGGPLPPVHDSDNAVYLWRPREGKKVRRLPGKIHDWAFNTVAFSPDGKTIVSRQINSGGVVHLWEAATGAERFTIQGGEVVFSPDGRTLAATWGDTIRLWDALTGKELRQLRGHEDIIYTLAFSPDGKTLASASEDTTVLLWDMAEMARRDPPAKDLAANELERLWEKLAQSDAAQAYKAIGILVDAKQTVSFLREHLPPIRVTVDRSRIDKLIDDLDSGQFEMRERATAELKKLGGLSEPALRKAIASRPPLEVRRRIEDLLDRLDHDVPSREELRGLRAVETLEHIGSLEARRVLEMLARGTPGFRLTDEARAAVERLSRRRALNP